MLGKITDAAPSTRWRDAINALHAGKSVITKAGVDEYLGKSLDAPGLNPQKLYKIYRSPEVIKAALPLMRGLRILDGHYFETADNLRNDKLVGTTGDEPEMKNGAALINVTIWDDRAIKEIEAKTKEQFSLGYAYKLDMTPGTAPDGRHYDGVLTEIIPEHVALVPVGRVNHTGNAGPLARIADTGEDMEFHEAMTAICQTCPDTPADIVRAAIMETLAKLNEKEAKNGPENNPKGGDKSETKGDENKSSERLNGEEKAQGMAKIIADTLSKLFTQKEPSMADEEEKKRLEREDRMARDMLHHMADKPKEKVRECLESMGLVDAAKRVLSESEKSGKAGDAPGFRHTQNDLFGGVSTNTISGGGHGRGGWNHDEAEKKEKEKREDDKEKRMKEARLEAKELLDKGMHKDAVALHLEKGRGFAKEEAEELVERSRHIPASEDPKGKTKDEEEAERKKAIRQEVEEQRKKERKEEEERRKKADKARDEVEKETGRLHGCKVGDSAEDVYRAGLASFGFLDAASLPDAALESTFRSFAAQRHGMSSRIGDSADQTSGDINSMAAELLG